MKAGTQVPGLFRFNGFEADARSGELRQHGRKLNLQEQPFQILLMLLEHPGEIVSRDDLRQRLWSADVFVDFEDGLNTAIKKLRVALGDSAENPTFIATLPRRGYRFIAPVKVIQETASTSSSGTVITENSSASRLDSLILKRGRSWVVVLVLAIIFAAFLWKATGWRGQARRTASVKALAVLPIANLSGDAGQEYFSDGMTDALITDLAKLHDLRVISRTSVMRYKKSPKSLPEIARELNVDAIVEGSTVRDGNKVRIIAQLVQGTTDQHLWAENYETDLRNIVNLQGDIARQIANQIQIRLSPQEKTQLSASRPVDPKAYEDYLKGRSYFEHWTEAGTLEARKYYRQAISIDPTYAQAYASLADAYVFGAVPESAEVAYPQARAAALKALQLDNSLAEAHAALAQIKFVSDWDWKGAEAEFQRAIDLDPNWTEARHMYSHYLLAMDRIADSEQQARRMVQIDPLSPVTHEHWAYQLLM